MIDKGIVASGRYLPGLQAMSYERIAATIKAADEAFPKLCSLAEVYFETGAYIVLTAGADYAADVATKLARLAHALHPELRRDAA